MNQPHLVATGIQLSPDNYFLIVDWYVISGGGNAVYALNALFCAHWAFKVDFFSIAAILQLPRSNLFGKKTDVFDSVAFVGFRCQKWPIISAVFLQLDYSMMFLLFHYSNFVLCRPMAIQIVWAFANHCNNLSSVISPCTRKLHFRSAHGTTPFKGRSTLCVKSWA